jgi:thiamine-phosphate pyrophosphorylase
MPRAPNCRLYLISPPAIGDSAAFASLALKAVAAGDVACFLLKLEMADDKALVAAARAVFPALQEAGVACLLLDRFDLVAACNADGVHIASEPGLYKKARAVLGPDAIVGVSCGRSRHIAMEVAEQGADYVAFDDAAPGVGSSTTEEAQTELLDWWQVMMEVPCVAMGQITPDNCLPLIEAGADFLALDPRIWIWPAGPAQAVESIGKACVEG